MMKNFNNPSKNFPPFGRELANKLRAGYRLKNNIWLFLGNACWKRARNKQVGGDAVLVFPPDQSDPFQFNWGIVSGLSILGIETTHLNYEIIRQLAYCLLKVGAKGLWLITHDFRLVIFRKDKEVV